MIHLPELAALAPVEVRISQRTLDALAFYQHACATYFACADSSIEVLRSAEGHYLKAAEQVAHLLGLDLYGTYGADLATGIRPTLRRATTPAEKGLIHGDNQL